MLKSVPCFKQKKCCCCCGTLKNSILAAGTWYSILLAVQLSYVISVIVKIASISDSEVATVVQLPSVVMATLVLICFLVRVVVFWAVWFSKRKQGRWCLTYVWLCTLAVWLVFVVWGLFLVPTRIKHWDAEWAE